MNFLPIALMTFKEGLKNRIFYGVIISALFLIVISILISGLFMRDVLKILLEICLSTTSFGGLLVPFFLAVHHLSGDIERKSIYTLLARSISRNDYILGKYVGLSLLTAAIMGILTLGTLLATFTATFIYPAYMIPEISVLSILVVVITSYCGILVLISCALFWCSITTSSFLATLLILSTYLIGQTVEDVVRFIASKVEGVSISPVVEITTKVSMYIFPNLSAFDLKQYATHNLPLPYFDIITLTIYAGCYIALMLFLAAFFLNRRDLV